VIPIESIRAVGLPALGPLGFEPLQRRFLWKVDRVLIPLMTVDLEIFDSLVIVECRLMIAADELSKVPRNHESSVSNH
jgi:hypothetical protein